MDLKTSSTSLWIKRLPNQLTFLRMACIPIVVWLMVRGENISDGKSIIPQNSDIIAASVFGLAAFTDFLDGWIARKFNVETVLGKLLDPLADKLLVVSALIILVEKQRLAGWVAVVLIVRDLAINAVRISALEDKMYIPSSWLGKTKTALIDLAIVGLIVHGTLAFIPFLLLGQIFTVLAVVASLVSGFQYLFEYGKQLKS